MTPSTVLLPPCTASIVGSAATEVEVEEDDVVTTMVSNSVMVASSVMICRSPSTGAEVEVVVGAEVDGVEAGSGVMTEDLRVYC